MKLERPLPDLRAQVRSLHEAEGIVRRSGIGKDRVELRQMLNDELSGRVLRVGRSTIERRLDKIEKPSLFTQLLQGIADGRSARRR